MSKSFTTTAFLMFDRTRFLSFNSVSDTTVLWPSWRTSGAGRKSIRCIRFVVRESDRVGASAGARAGAGAIELKGRRKVNSMGMNDGAGVALCVIIDGENGFDIVFDILALA